MHRESTKVTVTTGLTILFHILGPTQWTTVPVLVKIYKLLINELSNQIEEKMAKQKDESLSQDDEVIVCLLHSDGDLLFPYFASTCHKSLFCFL